MSRHSGGARRPVHLVSIIRAKRRRSDERHYVRTDLTLPADTALDVVEQMLRQDNRILFLIENEHCDDVGTSFGDVGGDSGSGSGSESGGESVEAVLVAAALTPGAETIERSVHQSTTREPPYGVERRGASRPHTTVHIFSSDNVVHGTPYENQLIEHFIDALLTPEPDTQTAGTSAAGLSAKEICVVEGLAAGRSSKQIALDMGLTSGTVTSLRSSIYQKLAVQNSAGAVAKVMRSGYAMPLSVVIVPRDANAPDQASE